VIVTVAQEERFANNAMAEKIRATPTERRR